MKWLMKFLQKLFAIREERETDVVKPFLDHLEDLRVTLFKMAFTLAGGMVVAFLFRSQLMTLVQAPLKPTGLTLTSLTFVEPLMLTVKLCFYAGIVISFPFLLYFIAEFVLPALTRKERRLLLPGIFAGFVLFGIGVVVAYDFLLPRTILWLYTYNVGMGFANVIQAGPYFSLVTHLTLACGLLAELPIVVIALALFGIVDYPLLKSTRAYAIVLIGILIAVLAPSPDPVTFITLALPVMGIYELCIWIVWLIDRRKAKTAVG